MATPTPWFDRRGRWKMVQEGNLAQLLDEKLPRLDFDFELFEGVDD